MIVVHVKRLFGKIASVRDYAVQSAIKSNRSLKIVIDGLPGEMVLTPEDLVSKKFQIGKKKFKSKFNHGQEYELIDFVWDPK